MESLYWVDSGGTAHLLTDDADEVQVLWGVTERYMPPFREVEEIAPLQPGSRLRDIQADTREIDIPVLITGSTSAERQRKLREWTQRFNPLFGAGKLRNVAEDGTTRELTCWYHSGFEIDESLGTATVNTQFAIVIFRARDPFWYDVNARGVGFVNDASSTPFFPFFPLHLAGSEVFAERAAVNRGDELAWPVWTINGPCADPVLLNVTSGERFALEGVTLTADESIVVDTRPLVKSVLKQDGSDLFASQAADSVLWALSIGTSTIEVELTESTEETSVLMTWNERFFAP